MSWLQKGGGRTSFQGSEANYIPPSLTWSVYSQFQDQSRISKFFIMLSFKL